MEKLKKEDIRKEETLKVLKNDSKIASIIDDYSEHCNLETFEDVDAIPIGFSQLVVDVNGCVILDETVEAIINNKVRKLTNNGSNSVEVPFFLIGSIQNQNDQGEYYIHIKDFIDGNDTYESIEAEYSSIALNNVYNASRNPNNTVIVICHSHPDGVTVSEKIQSDQNTKRRDVRRYAEEVKEKFKQRNSGLNASLNDLYQLIYFTHEVTDCFPGKKVLSMIYHFNGEHNFMYYDGEKINRIGVVFKLNNGKVEDVPTFDTNSQLEKDKEEK